MDRHYKCCYCIKPTTGLKALISLELLSSSLWIVITISTILYFPEISELLSIPILLAALVCSTINLFWHIWGLWLIVHYHFENLGVFYECLVVPISLKCLTLFVTVEYIKSNNLNTTFLIIFWTLFFYLFVSNLIITSRKFYDNNLER